MSPPHKFIQGADLLVKVQNGCQELDLTTKRRSKEKTLALATKDSQAKTQLVLVLILTEGCIDYGTVLEILEDGMVSSHTTDVACKIRITYS